VASAPEPGGDTVGLSASGAGSVAGAPADPAPAITRRVPMSRLRRRLAERLKEAQNTAAMLTTYNEVDMGAVMELRKASGPTFEQRHGVRLGLMSFFVKASVSALRAVPEVNAEIDGTDMVYKDFYDIGVAVNTDRGLVVPVIREADRKGFADIEREIRSFGERARAGALEAHELEGGTFTVSNGGVYGSLMSAPILNPPQSGILGLHRIQDRPVARAGQVVIRPMMYLALSYDHRIVDGKGAVTFLVHLRDLLEQPAALALDT
ncbi:MAG: dihydrolipoyllysine-residue succinyltransferase, partial [Rhodospirillales bacterium]|nr:dihydrolipoyllysine-residue succinyltransferase [Rhodospirillales bacterium]